MWKKIVTENMNYFHLNNKELKIMDPEERRSEIFKNRQIEWTRIQPVLNRIRNLFRSTRASPIRRVRKIFTFLSRIKKPHRKRGSILTYLMKNYISS
jgi:hypothetical protein